MMDDKKEFKVTQETSKLFLKSADARECMELAIKYSFFAKRALYYANKKRAYLEKAWEQVYDLYPELRGRNIKFAPDKSAIMFSEDVGE